MAKTVKDIEQDIRALSSEEKLQLLRTLLAELDAGGIFWCWRKVGQGICSRA